MSLSKIKDAVLNGYAIVFARPVFHPFNRLLLVLGLKGLGVLNYQNNRVSGEHHLITSLLPGLIGTKIPVLLDVGANVGHFSFTLAGAFPGARIYAFEPSPVSLKKARANNSFPEVKFLNLALGENPGKVLLYDRGDDSGSEHASLYREVIDGLHKAPVAPVEVSMTTLDEFAIAEKLGLIDFIKIDTEGNELSVLKGAKGLLEQKRIKLVQFEFNEMNVVSHVHFRDFRQQLKGFKFFRLLPDALLPIPDNPLLSEFYAFHNILAIRDDL